MADPPGWCRQFFGTAGAGRVAGSARVRSPGGGGRPGCRDDPLQGSCAQDPGAQEGLVPDESFAWHSPKPDPRRVIRAAAGLSVAVLGPWVGKQDESVPAARPALRPHPQSPRGGEGRQWPAAAAGSSCAVPDARQRGPHPAEHEARSGRESAARRSAACGADDCPGVPGPAE